MKVLVTYYKHSSETQPLLESKIISGGVAKFTRHICENIPQTILLELTHEDFLTGNDTRKTIETIHRHQPDVMITGDKSVNLTLDVWKEVKIPILSIFHEVMRDQETESMTRNLRRFLRYQKLLCFVSDFQFNTYQSRVPFELPKRVIRPSFVEEKHKPNYDFVRDAIVVARMDGVKHPFWFPSICDGKVDIFTGSFVYDDEYFDKYKKYHHILRRDFAHKDIMKTLNQSRVYIASASVECWSVAMLESLERGVPIIARSDNGEHCCFEYGNTNFVRTLPTDVDDMTMKQTIDELCKIDRAYIIEETKKYNDKDFWIDNFKDVLNETIRTYRTFNR